jgi:hypothetical protein
MEQSQFGPNDARTRPEGVRINAGNQHGYVTIAPAGQRPGPELGPVWVPPTPPNPWQGSGFPPHPPARKITATGRRRTAGWLISGGGLAVLVSAFLPWVAIVGFVSAGIGVYAVPVVALGGGLAYLGSRILLERTSPATTIALWVLAGLDLLIVIALFAGLRQLHKGTAGLVQPAVGFYAALLGLLGTLAGTILLQTTVRRQIVRSQTRQADR